MFPAVSTHNDVIEPMPAAVAGPPSPLIVAEPLPANVVIMPEGSIFRTRAPAPVKNKLPFLSVQIPAGT